jgi:hypothetical protein
MARDYGQIQHRIWADPDWRTLDADSQLMYLLLLSQPSMNQAGVLPLQLRKWSACVSGWDAETVINTLRRLHRTRFVVLDEDAEEVLVRTFIRNDGGYKIPGVLKSALKFARAVQSQAIRTALARELGRLPMLEGKTAADGMAAIAATRAALEPIGDPFPDPIKDPIPDGFVSNPSGIPSTEPIADPIKDPIPEPPLSGSGSVSGLSLVRNLGGKNFPAPQISDDEPPLCARHESTDRDEIPPCRACGRLRENWEATRVEASKPPPKPQWCGDCNQQSRLMEPDEGPSYRCPACHPLAVAS